MDFSSVDLSAHAYLVRTQQQIHELVHEFAEKGIELQGNPDCLLREYESLSVDDAREIATFAYYKPVGKRKYIIVSAGSINTEAQNALLKIIEEGVGSTTFLFCIAPGVAILPTLESRCVVVKDSAQHNHESGEAFLKMGPADRLKLAESFTKNHDREGARELVRSLLSLSETERFTPKKLRDLLEADQYLKLSGSSPKSVIGHLALVL